MPRIDTKSSCEVIVKPSPINGFGVFADQDIKRGEIVVRWDNTRELSQTDYAILALTERNYIEIRDGKIFLLGEPERYINHSCDPNTSSVGNSDIASRDIKRGEEITTDFSNFFLPNGSFTCTCHSPKCRGVIEGRMP